MSTDVDATGPSQPESFATWSAAEYVAKRVDQYIGWYDGKAVRMKSNYLRMRTAIVVGGVVVPVLVNLAFPWKDIVTSAISLIVAGCVALESVYHYREQWKNYRSTEQFLSREKVLFLTGEGGYKNVKSPGEALVYFVERCESAIEAENASTLNVMTLAQPDAKAEKPSAKRNEGG